MNNYLSYSDNNSILNVKFSFVFAVLILFSMFTPFLSFLCCAFLIVYTHNYKLVKLLPISLVFFFILINFNREFFVKGNDLEWYYTYFTNFSDYELGFFNAFEDDLASVSLKASEPLYHFFVYASSKATNGYYPAYILWVHCVIYLIPTFVIIEICKREKINVLICCSLVLFQMLVFYDFGNAYNLIRQQVASSFLVLTFYFMYIKKPWFCLFFAIVSVLTHNSTVLMAALILLFCLYNINYISYKLLLTATVLLSIFYVAVYFNLSGHYEDLEDKSRGLVVKLIDFSIFIFSGVIVFFYDSKYRNVYRFLVVLFIALMFCHISSFLPLRFLTFYDSFKWLNYFIIFNYFSTKLSSYKNANLSIFASCLILGFTYFNLKLTYTAYIYNGSFLDFVIDSPIYYLGIDL
ncbi:EpsG family protein [Shewanella sp. UCD-KL21]|uniref:EpsG family protein n=1 Tax=Shewanella sp. UCD-KL21 TaxID=1917164 RepID=UPI000970820C|nr:EpsG family protein [Shewanella sp. UCD-KL21]